MKHNEGRDAAHDLYVYQQMTFDEIAKRLGHSDKTIRNWADADGWREERERDFSARRNVHEKLHTLVQKITDRMITDCDAQNELSPQSLHALTNLIAAMNRAYKYETDEADAGEPAQKPSSSPEDIVARVREILGA
jgi:uncharacterized protein YjcR